MTMHRWLVCAGVDGSLQALDRLCEVVEHRRPDGVLFAGGVLSTRRAYVPRVTNWDMTRDDALFVEEFFEALGGLQTFAAVIPGPQDTPMDDFLRIGMHAELAFPTVHVVHATLIQHKDVAVCGLGGRVVSGNAVELDTCSRTQARYVLRQLGTVRQPHSILLLAVPPHGLLGGEEGSTLTDELIDTHHPALCVVGGGNEWRGVQRLGGTQIVNPGRLADGWAAWLDWDRTPAEQIELLDLRHPGRVPMRRLHRLGF